MNKKYDEQDPVEDDEALEEEEAQSSQGGDFLGLKVAADAYRPEGSVHMERIDLEWLGRALMVPASSLTASRFEDGRFATYATSDRSVRAHEVAAHLVRQGFSVIKMSEGWMVTDRETHLKIEIHNSDPVSATLHFWP